MALIKEDGSGVVGANSYNTEAEIREYATARGIVLPENDTDLAVLAIQATDFLETFRSSYQGHKTHPTQGLQFPRTGVVVDGYEEDPDLIPDLLKKAHAQATCEAYESDLIPNANQLVKREKVDVLEVEYQEQATSHVSFNKVEALLDPLFKRGSGLAAIRSKRV